MWEVHRYITQESWGALEVQLELWETTYHKNILLLFREQVQICNSVGHLPWEETGQELTGHCFLYQTQYG